MINRSVCTFFTDIDRCFMPSLIFMYPVTMFFENFLHFFHHENQKKFRNN